MADSSGSSSSTNTSNSASSSQSTSEPFALDLPQTPLLMDIARQAQGLAGQMLNWGQDQYSRNQQLTDNLIHEGNIYASPGRIKQDMGMAQAGVEQDADAARQNALRDLESFGIDPSSGRYAALDKAEQGKAAAAAAGAGNLQRMRTEDVGRQLRLQGTNASLQNEQVGAQLMKLPNDYLSTAMSLKYSPVGQKSQSTSTSTSTSHGSQGSQNQSTGSDPSGRGPGGGPGGGLSSSGGRAGGMQPDDTAAQGNSAYRSPGLPVGANNTAKIFDATGGTPGGGPDMTNYGEPDPTAKDYGGADYSTPGSDYQAPNPPSDGSWGYGGDDSYAQGGAIDIGAEDDGPTTGGFVSQDLSPSGGQDTDDIPANLNANEFVIPRDVALWKGQEFFQKLIQQSRQNRMAAPAHGTPSQQG